MTNPHPPESSPPGAREANERISDAANFYREKLNEIEQRILRHTGQDHPIAAVAIVDCKFMLDGCRELLALRSAHTSGDLAEKLARCERSSAVFMKNADEAATALGCAPHECAEAVAKLRDTLVKVRDERDAARAEITALRSSQASVAVQHLEEMHQWVWTLQRPDYYQTTAQADAWNALMCEVRQQCRDRVTALLANQPTAQAVEKQSEKARACGIVVSRPGEHWRCGREAGHHGPCSPGLPESQPEPWILHIDREKWSLAKDVEITADEALKRLGKSTTDYGVWERGEKGESDSLVDGWRKLSQFYTYFTAPKIINNSSEPAPAPPRKLVRFEELPIEQEFIFHAQDKSMDNLHLIKTRDDQARSVKGTGYGFDPDDLCEPVPPLAQKPQHFTIKPPAEHSGSSIPSVEPTAPPAPDDGAKERDWVGEAKEIVWSKHDVEQVASTNRLLVLLIEMLANKEKKS